MRSRRRGITTLVALTLAVPSLAPRRTLAHFVLRSPASWRDQGPLGDPQKVGPCGDEGTAATTGVVTAFSPGATITITLDETIFHPGHYRVALAVNDRSELPPEPPVTPGTTDCGSAPIMSPPVFPVLVDGALEHTDAFLDTQIIQVTLPSDVTCTHCTLQVLEFMTDHGAPCFYHHCADISIGTSGGACTGDADCADANACTTDHCNLTTSTCENVAGIAPCDDGDACTRDSCTAVDGCVAQPLTLAGVSAGFLGALEAPDCSTVQVPAVVGTLFGQAEGFVVRAGENPAKAKRFLTRASKRLRKAAKKTTKAEKRGLAAACGTALVAVLDEAQVRVQCLSNDPS